MSSKIIFNIKDKVFAKVPGCFPWPAIISEIKTNTSSQKRYKVYFYGTRQWAVCKPEQLFPYEENKFELGKPKKNKCFTEALLQIRNDTESSVLFENDAKEVKESSSTSNIEQKSSPSIKFKNIYEVDKINEIISESELNLTSDGSNVSLGKNISSLKKRIGISNGKNVSLSKERLGISKGKKRNISAIKYKESLRKSKTMKVPGNSKPFVQNKALKKNSSLKKATICQVYNAEEPKSSMLRKQNFINLKNKNNENIEKDTSLEQKLNTKGLDKSSEFQKPLKNYAIVSVLDRNNAVSAELKKIKDAGDKYGDLPVYLKSRITNTVLYCETEWKKRGLNIVYTTALLFIEIELLNLMETLCFSIKHNNYELTLQSLKQINELQLNSLMLKKNEHIIDTIINVINHVGNSNNLGLNLQDTQNQVLQKAHTVYNKFQSLFIIPKGKIFIDLFKEQVKSFHKNTMHLSKLEINSLTILLDSRLMSIPK